MLGRREPLSAILQSSSLQVELDLDHGGLLLDGGSWTFAFGLKNASTVHYRGDEAQLL